VRASCTTVGKPLRAGSWRQSGSRVPAIGSDPIGGSDTILEVERPTFDMSVLRVALDPKRRGHHKALRLLELSGEGVLEVGVPPQGVRADLRADMTTPQGQQLVDLLARPGVVELQQLAAPSKVTLPGEDFFPEVPVGSMDCC
jgi:hypothetical protein